MSSSRQKQRRKAEVTRIREEGAQAFRDGKHVQTVPHEYLGSMDRFVWVEGYHAAAQQENGIDCDDVNGVDDGNEADDEHARADRPLSRLRNG